MAKLTREQENLIEKKLQQIQLKEKERVGKKPIEYGVTKEGFHRILQRVSRPPK